MLDQLFLRDNIITHVKTIDWPIWPTIIHMGNKGITVINRGNKEVWSSWKSNLLRFNSMCELDAALTMVKNLYDHIRTFGWTEGIHGAIYALTTRPMRVHYKHLTVRQTSHVNFRTNRVLPHIVLKPFFVDVAIKVASQLTSCNVLFQRSIDFWQTRWIVWVNFLHWCALVVDFLRGSKTESPHAGQKSSLTELCLFAVRQIVASQKFLAPFFSGKRVNQGGLANRGQVTRANDLKSYKWACSQATFTTAHQDYFS